MKDKTKGAKGPIKKENEGLCKLPRSSVRPLGPGVHPRRARLIRESEKKWANGTVLHYHFLERPRTTLRAAWNGGEEQKEVVRRAFSHWKAVGLGLEFREVESAQDAEVRIAFDQRDGSWSYVGRDVIDIARDPGEATMNYGWDLSTAYGWETALHEIGHTLGFPHAHQTPFAGIEWDEKAVYEHFSKPPNAWDEDTIYWNILRKLDANEVNGSPWDPNSIMQYEFEGGLILSPEAYQGGLNPQPGLSGTDIEWVQRFYPPLEESVAQELVPFKSEQLNIQPGKQVNFNISPDFSRDYTLQTFGQADTVMVLFEVIDGVPRYLAGNDDSGQDFNARIDIRLNRGRQYILRVRLYYSTIQGECAVMYY